MFSRTRGIVAMADHTFRPALEEAATGVANEELELVYYAKLHNPQVLERSQDKEDQEQWELRIRKEDENAMGGRMRVRKTTTANGQVEYVRTTKTKMSNGAEREVALPSSEDEFEQFKMMSPRGMIKTRYTFDIPGRPDKWEIDTFQKDGKLFPWVKIDLEITDGNMSRPPFPLDLIDETSLMSMMHKSSEQAARIRELYEHFITPNVYLNAPRPEVDETAA